MVLWCRVGGVDVTAGRVGVSDRGGVGEVGGFGMVVVRWVVQGVG